MQVQNLEPLQVAQHLATCWQTTERGGEGRAPLTGNIVLRTQCRCNSFLQERLSLTASFRGAARPALWTEWISRQTEVTHRGLQAGLQRTSGCFAAGHYRAHSHL